MGREDGEGGGLEKVISFFTKNPNLKRKKKLFVFLGRWSVGGGGGGVGGGEGGGCGEGRSNCFT